MATVLGGSFCSIVKDAAVVRNGRKWGVTLPSEAAEWVSTRTQQGKARLGSVKDWTGSYDAYGATPITKPGDAFTFHGSIDGVKGINGDVIAGGVLINLAHETGEPIGHAVDFEGNGAYTLGNEAGDADVTTEPPASAMGLPAKITPVGGDEFQLTDVRSASLGITRELHGYVSSDTVKQRKRLAAGWDAEMSISAYISNPAEMPVQGTFYQIKIYTTGAAFWDIKWGLFLEASGIEVDRETGAIVAATLRFAFSGLVDIGGTPTIGYIKTPAVVTWWPVP